jgi:nicotinamidase-related amidase
MLKIDNTVLLIVDIQGKLAHLMHDKDALLSNAQKLIQGLNVLDIPILWMEQNPRGIGATIPEIAELLPDNKPLSKTTFSCCQNQLFLDKLRALKRQQILIVGIETHICIYQTAVELVTAGYEVQVVSNAVSSRTYENKEIGLQKMVANGVVLTGVETALFELLGKAEGEKFKKILAIIK